MNTQFCILSSVFLMALACAHTSAIEQWQHAFQEYPDDISRHLDTVDALQKEGHYEESRILLHLISARKKIDWATLHRIGCLSIMIGDIETALNAFNKMLTATPNNIQARYNLAYTLKMAGLVDQAIAIYQDIPQKTHHNHRF